MFHRRKKVTKLEAQCVEAPIWGGRSPEAETRENEKKEINEEIVQ